MNKDLHDIDNLFKQSIDDHLEEVPPDVWQNIDHGLDKKQAAFYKRRYFTVRAAAILLLLVGGVTIAAILRYHSSERKGGGETIVTNAKSKQMKADDQATKKLNGADLNKTKEIPLEDRTVENKPSKESVAVGKESPSEFATTENSTYSAEKNEDILNGTGKRKGSQKKQATEAKAIVTTPAVVVQQSSDRSQAVIAVSKTKDVAQETVNMPVRTNYVDARVLNVNAFTINNSLPDPQATNIIAPDFASAAPAIAEKSRNFLGKWSIAPMYAQNINLNRLKDDDHYRDPRNNSREARRTEQETKSFSLGLGIQKELGANVSLQTGVQYFSSQTTIQPKMIFAEPDSRGEVRYRFNCSSGDSYIPSKTGVPPMIGDSIRTNSSESSLSYLQVPLLASYKIGFGKISILPSAGIQGNFLLSSKLSSSLVQPSGDEEVYSSIDGLRSMYFSGVLQPQLNYKFNDRISFDLNPNINFSLSPINKETAVKTYQNMFSIGAALRIRL